MTPDVRKKFGEVLVAEERQFDQVLEVGALPDTTLLDLEVLQSAKRKVGVDLSTKFDVKALAARDIELNSGIDAHKLPFKPASFDLVLCNSVLEHDPWFWLTLAEIKRVAMPGGLVVLGAPAFGASGQVLGLHHYPFDCYRFGADAVYAWLDGYRGIRSTLIMEPPRLIAWGRR